MVGPNLRSRRRKSGTWFRAIYGSRSMFLRSLPASGNFSDVREELGFIPWCFNLPACGHEAAWAQLTDPQGFRAPFGITTAERRHPKFSFAWLVANANGMGRSGLSRRPKLSSLSATCSAIIPRNSFTSRDYFDAFLTYVHSQHYDGKPYIGEYLDETTGQWL